MRIVAGSLGGRRLPPLPRGSKLRPTTGRVRESLMSILMPRLAGASFADLYAGSGAIGLEALSRGAREVLWVEQDGSLCLRLERVLRDWGLEGADVRVRREPVERILRDPPQAFDIVFADPPYPLVTTELVMSLGHSRLLAPGGLLVLEHSAAFRPPPALAASAELRTRRFGDSSLTFVSRHSDLDRQEPSP